MHSVYTINTTNSVYRVASEADGTVHTSR